MDPQFPHDDDPMASFGMDFTNDQSSYPLANPSWNDFSYSPFLTFPEQSEYPFDISAAQSHNQNMAASLSNMTPENTCIPPSAIQLDIPEPRTVASGPTSSSSPSSASASAAGVHDSPNTSQDERKRKADSISQDEEDNMGTIKDEKNVKKTRRRRKTKPKTPEEAQQKRQKFLERNKVAASKCRDKKKADINRLQERSSYLQQENHSLYEELVMVEMERDELLRLYATCSTCVPADLVASKIEVTPQDRAEKLEKIRERYRPRSQPMSRANSHQSIHSSGFPPIDPHFHGDQAQAMSRSNSAHSIGVPQSQYPTMLPFPGSQPMSRANSGNSVHSTSISPPAMPFQGSHPMSRTGSSQSAQSIGFPPTPTSGTFPQQMMYGPGQVVPGGVSMGMGVGVSMAGGEYSGQYAYMNAPPPMVYRK